MTINQITNYESGKAVVVPEDEWNYYASGVCYNLYFYAQQVHALMHVLHYLMTTGIVLSTEHDKGLNEWAEPYNDNIHMKYLQVAALLFESSFTDREKLLTGENGLGGNVESMTPLRDLLCQWGSCKTADDFVKKSLLKDLYATAKDPEKVIESANIITECLKHYKNVDLFAPELSAAMKADDSEAFETTEEQLAEFMCGCGEGVSSIDSISSFVALMSSTGIMHGSTLSYSRLTVMPEVLRWWDIEKKEFEEGHANVVDSVTDTIQGVTLDRHVFTAEINHGKRHAFKRVPLGIKKAMDKYDAKALELKQKYESEIQKREDFREFGWILSDHCPDGFDGKQHSIATYF